MGKQILVMYELPGENRTKLYATAYSDAEANLQKGYLRERYPLARVGIHDADSVNPNVFAK